MIVRVLVIGFSVVPSAVTLDSSELPLSSREICFSTKRSPSFSMASVVVPLSLPSCFSV
jgi:hypothetical protein